MRGGRRIALRSKTSGHTRLFVERSGLEHDEVENVNGAGLVDNLTGSRGEDKNVTEQTTHLPNPEYGQVLEPIRVVSAVDPIRVANAVESIQVANAEKKVRPPKDATKNANGQRAYSNE